MRAASSLDEAPDHRLHLCIAVASDTSGDNGTVSVVQSFIESFKRPLEQPLIASPSRLRITKDLNVADDDDITPKRSARLAAKNKLRAPKLEA